ncbi:MULTISPECIES: tyrosinase family protein [unclassified Streptomyces]|uniref:tyrosinase family protein n=1 Tax=unclassified Streptomyces TaxID=2593676 RepID=UPI0028C4AB61|nr:MULTISPECIES: tyrosinase family protein [unclassified Streptomyces]WNO72610.1 tyrosinase family protein [Streptomyces sp. AM8-1-1]
MHTRKNQRNLSRSEKRRLVDALLALKRSGRYDEFVRMHGEYYVPDAEKGPRAAHMTPSFFPWHRRFLLEFERALQKVDPGVSVPYWDWTTDNTPAASLWAEDFLGGNGRTGDRQVMTGPFAYSNGNWRINARVTEGKFLTRNFGRPSDPVSLPTKNDVAKALREPAYDAAPWDSTAKTGFRNAIEGWSAGGPARWRNHNRVHRWVGGLMLGATSPNDPVFWLHHAFMDLLWIRWQQAHPRSGYLPRTRLAASDPQAGRVFALDEPMPPWNVRPSALLDHSRLYRYA